MTQPRGSGRAARLFGELFVIVAGVLIALGVDAWWAEVGDRRLEQVVLESLDADVERAAEAIQTIISADSAIIGRASGYPAQNSGASTDSVYTVLSGLFATFPRRVHLRTYDELLGTGRLNLISSRELRLLLTDFDLLADALGAYSDQMAEQWNVTARPVLYDAIKFEGMAGQSVGMRGVEGGPVAQDPTLLAHDALRNVVLDRRAFARVHRIRAQRLRSMLEEIRELTAQGLRQ